MIIIYSAPTSFEIVYMQNRIPSLMLLTPDSLILSINVSIFVKQYQQ